MKTITFFFCALLCPFFILEVQAQSNIFPSSGNVGIGTTSPRGKLQINAGSISSIGAQSNLGAYISGGGWNGNVMELGFGYGTNYVPASIGHIVTTQSGNTKGALFFSTRDVTTDTAPEERMRIDAAGNIGIGISSPGYRLHLATNSTVNNVLAAFQNGSGEGFEISHTGSDGGAYGVNNAVVLASSYFSGGSFRPLVFGTSNSPRMIIKSDGNIGIGTINPDAALTVAGNIHSREVKVTPTAGADFVFDDDYKLRSLEETEKFIRLNKHLPEIAPAAHMVKNGIELGGSHIKLLQKIEELTLHLIELNKTVERQQLEMEKIKSKL